MSADNKTCPQLASLLRANRELFSHDTTHMLEKYSLPIGWHSIVSKLLDNHKHLLNCDASKPLLTASVINAENGNLQIILSPRWGDNQPPSKTPLLIPTPESRGIEQSEAEQIERLFASAPEPLTRWHMQRASSHLIDSAKDAARHTCEQCGNSGEMKRDLSNPRVLCDQHYVQALYAQKREASEPKKGHACCSRENSLDDDDDVFDLDEVLRSIRIPPQEDDTVGGV